jgi:hypothetical protein
MIAHIGWPEAILGSVIALSIAGFLAVLVWKGMDCK